MWRSVLTVWVLACMILTDHRVQAQQIDVVASADSVHIGERFLFTVSVLHGFPAASVFPTPGDADFGDLDNVQVVSSGSVMLDADARLDSIVYDVTTFVLDSAVVPALPVLLDGGSRRHATREFVIPIISVVPSGADSMRGMAAPVAFLEPGQRATPPWSWVLLTLALLLAVGSYFWYTRKRTTVVAGEDMPDSSLLPYEIAMSRLKTLRDTDLTGYLSEVGYFVALSETLRLYLERRIGVPALELTTTEVLRELSFIRHKVPGGIPDDLQSVLQLSDLVKFAEFTPPVAESVRALTAGIDIVERLEAKQKQLELDAARLENN